MTPSIIIAAPHENGTISPPMWGLLAAARHMGGELAIAILEDTDGRVSNQLATLTGATVLAIQDPTLSRCHPERHCQVMAALLQEIDFTHLLLSHDAGGIDMAPFLALRLGAACIAGVDAITREKEQFRYTRPVMGGKLAATVTSCRSKTVLTLLPGAFSGEPPHPADNPGRVITCPLPACAVHVEVLEEVPGEMPADGITDARVIVAAGNGIGSEEGLDLIREMAGLFPRSAVAGSRPVCDRGWLPYNRQVGVTGTSVSPELYIACGISGAYQHVAAMQGSGLVVAINRDAAAPMCRCADLCIIEDLTRFIPAFVDCAAKNYNEE